MNLAEFAKHIEERVAAIEATLEDLKHLSADVAKLATDVASIQHPADTSNVN